MKTIFDRTHDVLMFLSNITGFSYKEVNIIIWFILIPLSWTFLIDKIKGRHWFKVYFSVFLLFVLLLIDDFSVVAESLFDASADFLRKFNTIGSNYTISSVVICLIIPFIIFVLLINKAYFKKRTM